MEQNRDRRLQLLVELHLETIDAEYAGRVEGTVSTAVGRLSHFEHLELSIPTGKGVH